MEWYKAISWTNADVVGRNASNWNFNSLPPSDAYGNIYHWHQAIAWTSVDYFSMKSGFIHLKQFHKKYL